MHMSRQLCHFLQKSNICHQMLQRHSFDIFNLVNLYLKVGMHIFDLIGSANLDEDVRYNSRFHTTE